MLSVPGGHHDTCFTASFWGLAPGQGEQVGGSRWLSLEHCSSSHGQISDLGKDGVVCPHI